ncbi:MAG: 1-acyl-sn-glycerol-3-phosphate acyltransferase, partial [Bacteroidota bacterium]
MEQSNFDTNNFDSIRPYNDAELKEAIERVLQVPEFYKMLKWVYPGLSKTSIQRMLREVNTVEEFQAEISGPAFKMAIQTTTSGLTFTNFESLNKNQAYLFLSNHRDIILDSAILNVSLLEQGFKSTQIAIGDNLLRQKVVEDIVRSNKNFIVNRNVSAKEIFYYSLRLSNYIAQTISKDNTSIWIAQREGRSKDGDDRTATGLLKMFAMSGDNIEDTLSRLNIIPMAVSYEYDPCDLLKTNELMHLRQFGEYEKKSGEDFLSMLKGITGHKGHVNITMGTNLHREIDNMRSIVNKNEKYRYL